MVRSVLYGASDLDAYDGSFVLPDGDAIFPGTLFSYQPGHKVYGEVAAPVHGGVAKNAAWRQAAKALGLTSADEALLHGVHTLGSDALATKFKQELTAKGGLHTIISHTLGNQNTHWFMSIPAAIRARIRAMSTIGGASVTDQLQVWNQPGNHRFGQFLWIKPTRMGRTDSGKVGNTTTLAGITAAGNISGVPTFGTMGITTNVPSYPVAGVEDTGQSTTSATLIGNMNYPSGAPTLLMPQMKWEATRGWFNSYPANEAAIQGVVGAGPQPGQGGAGFQQSAPSYVLYRYDIIDLWHDNLYPRGNAFRGFIGTDYSHLYGDIYGTRDQVMAAYNRAFAPGGAYYNDNVPTDPATIP